MFAVIALFVGAFIIFNTFSIIVTQRQKEMALLRAIGASSKQVMRSVMVEAFAVGRDRLARRHLPPASASPAGLKKLLDGVRHRPPGRRAGRHRLSTVIISLIVGTIGHAGLGVLPGPQGRPKVPPIAAMRSVAHRPDGAPRKRPIIGSLDHGPAASASMH